MNPGEIWRLEDGSLRIVLSNAIYNTSQLNQVITAVVGPPPEQFEPFAVATDAGTVFADRLAMHPRHWLTQHVATISVRQLADTRRHLTFLLHDD